MKAVSLVLAFVALSSAQGGSALIDALKLREGMVAAALGNIGESFRTEVTKALGPRGKLIAAQLSAAGDPGLGVATVDLVILDPLALHAPVTEQVLAFVRSAIKPEGRLFVITSDSSLATRIEASGFDRIAEQPLSSVNRVIEFQRP